MAALTRSLVIALAVVMTTTAGAGSGQYRKGSVLLARGDYQGAVKALTKALEQDPRNIGALLNRGAAHERLEQFAEALGDYTRAIEVDSGFAMAYHNRGHVHSKTGNHERAIADYDEALRRSDIVVVEATGVILALDKAAAHYDRGNALFTLKKYEQAIASYDSAIALSGRFAAAYNNRGVAYSELGDKQAACRDRAKACELGFAAACKWIEGNC